MSALLNRDHQAFCNIQTRDFSVLGQCVIGHPSVAQSDAPVLPTNRRETSEEENKSKKYQRNQWRNVSEISVYISMVLVVRL